jgi:hypothetical protein
MYEYVSIYVYIFICLHIFMCIHIYKDIWLVTVFLNLNNLPEGHGCTDFPARNI